MEPIDPKELKGIAQDFLYHGLNHVIKFGKYSGMTVKQIGELDSEYIIWLHENNIIKPNAEVFKIIKAAKEFNESESKDYLKSATQGRDFWDSIFG